MRLNAEQMNWQNITPVLKKGVIMENKGHHMDPKSVNMFVNPTSRIAFTSARSTKQMEIGQDNSAGIIEQLKTGELFPDQIAGFSTKSILVILLVLMIVKGR
jgi:hypothetical protein